MWLVRGHANTGAAGLDLSPVGIDACKNKVPDMDEVARRASGALEKGQSRIQLRVANVTERLPLEAGSVDLVLSVEAVQEYSPRQLAHLVSEASRVLRPGGHLAVAFFCDIDADLAREWHYEAYQGLSGQFNHVCEDLPALAGANGLDVVKLQDMTQNVVAALSASKNDLLEWLREDIPRSHWDAIAFYGAFPGTPMFDFFKHGLQKYYIMQAKKRTSTEHREL
eukprot:TRINITY_DN41896_c0_g1_i1.p1 TRINITY_DN41896_c0_g1~~TRINITY_DN41896_c0_g1_i1.p1  ORF type:complete len:224 (+),score=52.31 TRINITY_DN41896_c0_g1_i1:382-1053(+)